MENQPAPTATPPSALNFMLAEVIAQRNEQSDKAARIAGELHVTRAALQAAEKRIAELEKAVEAADSTIALVNYPEGGAQAMPLTQHQE